MYRCATEPKATGASHHRANSETIKQNKSFSINKRFKVVVPQQLKAD
jgi:hypothetical protein